MPDARVEVEADRAAEVPTHVVLAHPVFSRVLFEEGVKCEKCAGRVECP